MIKLKKAIFFLAKFFFYSLIIILIDTVLIFIFLRDFNDFTYNLTLLMLIEGGLGLILGSFVASFSPSVAKLGEILFRSKPQDFTRKKETEKQMREVIIMSLIFIIEALIISGL